MLEPGHLVEIDLESKRFKKKCYFSFTTLISENLYMTYSEMPEEKIHEIFKELLVKSIQKRLVADVPIASINSGGIDSSIISTIASKYIEKIFFVSYKC